MEEGSKVQILVGTTYYIITKVFSFEKKENKLNLFYISDIKIK